MAPDHLQAALVLTGVIAALNLSNLIVHESGLFTATIMGVMLANQRRVAAATSSSSRKHSPSCWWGCSLSCWRRGWSSVPCAKMAPDHDSLHPFAGAGGAAAGGLVQLGRGPSRLAQRAFVAWMARAASSPPLSHRSSAAPQGTDCRRRRCWSPMCFWSSSAPSRFTASPARGSACVWGCAGGKWRLPHHRRRAAGGELGQFLTSEGIEVLLVDTNIGNVARCQARRRARSRRQCPGRTGRRTHRTLGDRSPPGHDAQR